MSCYTRNNRKPYCTEPKRIRQRLTKILCGELNETTRQIQTRNRQSCAEQIDINFNRLFANRGATTNLGQCTKIRNPKCSQCKLKKVKPLVLF